MKTIFTWAAILVILAGTVAAFAAPPKTINYQGYLSFKGAPATGPLSMTFSLYSSNPARNNPVWQETQPAVPVTNGIYSIQLGSVTPITAPFDVPYYLGVQVAGESEMTPQPLSSAPYAVRAGVADNAISVGQHVHQAADLPGTVVLTDTIQTISGAKTFSSPATSTVATGTAPLNVASTTQVTNFNAEMVGGKKLADLDSRYASGLSQTPPIQNPRANSITTIDSTGIVGLYSSIIIGTDELPVLAYYDQTNHDLKVAKCTNAACSSGTIFSSVDSTGDVGTGSSITIGTDGLPVISYYDTTNADLKVAKCANIACSGINTITTVDSTGDVGLYSSITIGTDGWPVISYFDRTSGRLKVAKCGNTSCTSSTTTGNIFSTAVMGQFTSITIGSDGLPIISYYDNTNLNGNLRVAKCNNADCSSYSSTPIVGNGSQSSITIGSDGLPIISYFGLTTGDLKVVKCANTSCSSNSIFIIDSGGVGEFSSITIGTDGLPVISYYDNTNRTLKLAKCTNAACSSGSFITTVDHPVVVNGSLGEYTSITIGADGLPVISYFDNVNVGHLKVAKCANQFCLNNWSRR